MSENNTFEDDYIDISSNSSTSKKSNSSEKPSNQNPLRRIGKEVGKYIEKYGNGMFKHMGGIIKFIAFLICFAIIIASFIVAYFLYSSSSFDKILSLSILGGGTAIALIILFMIYGVGHIICQNNVIITRLNQILKKDDDQ